MSDTEQRKHQPNQQDEKKQQQFDLIKDELYVNDNKAEVTVAKMSKDGYIPFDTNKKPQQNHQNQHQQWKNEPRKEQRKTVTISLKKQEPPINITIDEPKVEEVKVQHKDQKSTKKDYKTKSDQVQHEVKPRQQQALNLEEENPFEDEVKHVAPVAIQVQQQQFGQQSASQQQQPAAYTGDYHKWLSSLLPAEALKQAFAGQVPVVCGSQLCPTQQFTVMFYPNGMPYFVPCFNQQ